MAIYIKGVDIPTNCTDCRYRPLVGCNPYQDNGLSPSDHRHRTCPLTEVPEPHGRLIDADACIDYIRNNNQHAWEALAYAPTVIESEVEE